MFKNKFQIALGCMFTDIALSVWSYFELTNYDNFLKFAKPIVSSPDLQVQIYKILIQSFTFTMLLFLAFHLIIYVLYTRENKFAAKYVRFYALMAAISSGIMIATGVYLGIFPLFIYFFCYRAAKKQILLPSTPPPIPVN